MESRASTFHGEALTETLLSLVGQPLEHANARARAAHIMTTKLARMARLMASIGRKGKYRGSVQSYAF